MTHTKDHIVNLEDGEKIIAEVRKHLFVFYTQTLFLFIFLLVPLLFIKPVSLFLDGPTQGSGLSTFVFFFALWALGVWMAFFLKWTDYYLDVWVITDKRIFDIEQRGLFNREISVFRLDRLQDVTIEVSGIIATFLKYGNIHLHTAGESTDFIIRTAADPLHIKRVIMEQHNKYIESHVQHSPNQSGVE